MSALTLVAQLSDRGSAVSKRTSPLPPGSRVRTTDASGTPLHESLSRGWGTVRATLAGAGGGAVLAVEIDGVTVFRYRRDCLPIRESKG